MEPYRGILLTKRVSFAYSSNDSSSVILIAYTKKDPVPCLVFELVPITQSFTVRFKRNGALQQAIVQYPQYGFGANPWSYLTTYEQSFIEVHPLTVTISL